MADGCEADEFNDIIQHHSHLVKRAHFYLPASMAALTSLLSALASYPFPQLSNLRLDHDAATELFGEMGGKNQTAGQVGRWEVFKAVAADIVDLEANAMSEMDLATLLPLFPRLRILAIEDVEKSPGGSGMRRLCKLQQLEELAITSADTGGIRLLESWSRYSWLSLKATLTRLRIHELLPTSTLSLDAWSFIEQFDLLHTLEITVGQIAKPVQKRAEGKSSNRKTFPFLREVHIWSLPAQARTLLTLLPASPLAILSFGYIQLLNSLQTSRRHARNLFDYAIRHYSSTLRRISWALEVSEVDPSPHLGFSVSHHIRQTCQSLNIRLEEYGAMYDPFLHGAESLTGAEDWEVQLRDRLAGVDGVLEWAIRRARQSELEGDEQGAAEMKGSVDGLLASLMEGLRPFKARMEVERD